MQNEFQIGIVRFTKGTLLKKFFITLSLYHLITLPAHALCHTTTFGLAMLFGGTTVSAANAAIGEDGRMSGWYLGTNVLTGGQGTSLFNNSFVNMSFGYSFQSGMRLEMDFLSTALTEHKDGHDHGHGHGHSHGWGVDVGIQSIRALYDIRLGGRITPFVGMGVQSMAIYSDYFDFDISMIAGLTFNIARNFIIDLAYERNQVHHHGHGHAGQNMVRLGTRSFF